LSSSKGLSTTSLKIHMKMENALASPVDKPRGHRIQLAFRARE
jgi:hypothetical protein